MAAGAAFTNDSALRMCLVTEARGRQSRLRTAIEQGHQRRAASIENAMQAEALKHEKNTDPPAPETVDDLVTWIKKMEHIAEHQGRLGSKDSQLAVTGEILGKMSRIFRDASPSGMLAAIGRPASELSMSDRRSLSTACAQRLGGQPPTITGLGEIINRWRFLLSEYKSKHKATFDKMQNDAKTLRNVNITVPSSEDGLFQRHEAMN